MTLQRLHSIRQDFVRASRVGERSFKGEAGRRCMASVNKGAEYVWKALLSEDITELKPATRSQVAQSRGFPEASSSGANQATEDEAGLGYRPLRIVVKDAVKRWFNEAHKEAVKGDTKQQALLGQMMVEGYGCKQDIELGREWTERARKRGYKMAGVYCEI